MNEKLYELLNAVQRTAVQAGNVASDAAYGVSKKAGELLAVAIEDGKLSISDRDLRER